MLFNTIEFWLFFIPVVSLVYLLPHKGQNIVLLIASYIFYAAWDWRFLFLIFISTLVDFFAAQYANPKKSVFSRKIAVTISVVINLGILGFFKYYDFFIQSFADLFTLNTDLTNSLLLNILLPVGISFYTFQTMSYTLDVYAGKISPIKSLSDFALYVAFFPQLVAGPIERGAKLIPQITTPRTVNLEKIKSAAILIVWGLFKKVFIADTLAHPVNVVFASTMPTGPEVYLATICFAIQIYCDFSGYTDIARGLARLMGFDLMLNFNLPYIAKSPSDFWHRWHISLSSWLRDYLYIPLGGNRHGKYSTYKNIMITMILGGLWHGARYNFILWGAYHGLLLITHKIINLKNRNGEKDENKFLSAFKILGMFHLTLIGWLLFRVKNLSQLLILTSGLFSSWNSWESAMGIITYIAPVVTPLISIQVMQIYTNDLEFISKSPLAVRAAFLGICISSVLFLNRSAGMPFIYFQF